MNYLEELAAEFYEYKKYFIRRNVRTLKRDRGGYDVEMDVLAYKPKERELLHIETSGAATTWKSQRETLIQKKFGVNKKEYEKELGCEITSVSRVVVIGWARNTEPYFDKDIEVIAVPAFIRRIADEVRQKDPAMEVVPELYPLLRSIQWALHYC